MIWSKNTRRCFYLDKRRSFWDGAGFLACGLLTVQGISCRRLPAVGRLLRLAVTAYDWCKSIVGGH
ncbi:MAG: hypothetical protein J1E63_05165 [Muribaculaceae bacterium]|nr:hypothetical protein [Muribaculaceae bacterium]